MERSYRTTVAPQAAKRFDKDTALYGQMAYSLDTMDPLAKLCVHSSTLV